MAGEPKFLAALSKQGLWYSIASFAAKLSGFLLLPFLTDEKLLTVSAFGVLGIVEVTLLIGVAAGSLQSGTAIIQFGITRKDIFGSAWMVSTLGGLFAATVIILLFSLSGNRYGSVALWAAAQLFFEVQLQFVLSNFRSRGKAGLFSIVASIRVLLSSALIWLSLINGYGLAGVIASNALAVTVVALGALLFFLYTERPELRLTKNASYIIIQYSLPMVMSALSSVLLNAGDRYLLSWLSDGTQLGLYNLAGRFAGLVNMFVVQSFMLAWHPMLVKLNPEKHPAETVKVYRLLASALVAVAVGVSVLAVPVLHVMSGSPAYFSIGKLILLLSFGFVFYGLAAIEIGHLLSEGRTKIVSAGIGLAILLNGLLNVLVIPLLHATGAALATLACYAALWLFLLVKRSAVKPFHIPFFRVLLSVCVILASTFVFFPSAEASFFEHLAAASLIIPATALVLILFQLITPNDFKSAFELWKNRVQTK
jgi:O-antigen/teichoic acid export membrane protein